jgi:hypothetical protein
MLLGWYTERILSIFQISISETVPFTYVVHYCSQISVVSCAWISALCIYFNRFIVVFYEVMKCLLPVLFVNYIDISISSVNLVIVCFGRNVCHFGLFSLVNLALELPSKKGQLYYHTRQYTEAKTKLNMNVLVFFTADVMRKRNAYCQGPCVFLSSCFFLH